MKVPLTLKTTLLLRLRPSGQDLSIHATNKRGARSGRSGLLSAESTFLSFRRKESTASRHARAEGRHVRQAHVTRGIIETIARTVLTPKSEVKGSTSCGCPEEKPDDGADRRSPVQTAT